MSYVNSKQGFPNPLNIVADRLCNVYTTVHSDRFAPIIARAFVAMSDPQRERRPRRGKYKARRSTLITNALEAIVAASDRSFWHLVALHELVERKRAEAKATHDADWLKFLGEMDHHVAGLIVEIEVIDREAQSALTRSKLDPQENEAPPPGGNGSTPQQ